MIFIYMGAVIVFAALSSYLTYKWLQPQVQQAQTINAETAQKNKELQQQYNDLNASIEGLKNELIKLTTEKNFTVNQIAELTDTLQKAEQTAQETADNYYQSSLQSAKEKLAQQLILEQQKYDAALAASKDQFFSKQLEINEEINELKANLTIIKSKYDAVIEEAKRREEMENKLDYYRIIIPEEDKNEINALMSIEHLLSNKRNLYMLIWSSYYTKRVNELAVRVLGNQPIMGIYRITNIETQQMYIGQAKDIRERWREHCKCGLRIDTPGSNKLYPNMIKYGIENFTFELMEKCDNASQLNEKEKYWIEFYDTYHNGLNNTQGNK